MTGCAARGNAEWKHKSFLLLPSALLTMASANGEIYYQGVKQRDDALFAIRVVGYAVVALVAHIGERN